MKTIIVLAALFFVACDSDPWPAERQARLAGKRLDAPCLDEATLLGTGAGSPSEDFCWNSRHRMEASTVAVAGKDVAVLVICRCGPPKEGK